MMDEGENRLETRYLGIQVPPKHKLPNGLFQGLVCLQKTDQNIIGESMHLVEHIRRLPGRHIGAAIHGDDRLDQSISKK